jgi:hypothetical protein
MPAPRFDETDSDDEEDSGQKAAKAAQAIFAQTKDVGEKYGAVILAALVLFGLLYFWLVVLPKPLTVTVGVTEADSGLAITGAQVSAEYLASPYIFTSVKKNIASPLGEGKYTLRNVPSNTDDIKITVTKSGYNDYADAFSTDASAKAAPVTLFRKTLLKVESAVVFGSIGPSCTKSFNVLVNNTDAENDLDAALASANLPYFISEKKTVAAGETANVSFSIMTNYPDSDKNPSFFTGEVHISGTRQRAAVNLTLTQKPELELDSNEIANKIGDTKLVKISNGGKGRITGVRLTRDASSSGLVDLTGISENEAFDLEPGQVRPVYVTSRREGRGFISVSADCTTPLTLALKISAD